MDKQYIQVDRHQYRIKTQSNSPSLLSKAFAGMVFGCCILGGTWRTSRGQQ